MGILSVICYNTGMDKNQTICLLNDSFPPIIDGVSNAVLNYARNIERDHGHALVVTPQIPGADDSTYDFNVVRYPSIDTRKLIGYVTGYPFSPEAAHEVEAQNVSLLHTHCPVTSCLLARQLAEAYGLPLVLTWHTKYDIDIANAVKSKALQEGALQALLRNVNACDEIWTVSKGAGENLRSIGFEGDYIVMPNGVDLPRENVSDDLVAETTSNYDLPDGVPCFLFIGRLMWYKGLRIILDALKELEEDGADFRMVFVGGGGDEREVRDYTAGLGLDEKVFFTGAISNREKLRAWYTRADLFLFPSTFDTNGLVVREAAASDTASVIVAGSCASEGVTDGRNGFLIEENSASLAAKLRELCARPELMKEVGRGAGDELYISWEDAVAHAYERYGAVIDNYRSGVYGKHDPIRGSWMQSQGELMQILGDIDAARKTLIRNVEDLQDELDSSFRSMKNKAIVDAITTRYEAKERLSDIQNEILKHIKETGEDIWEKLDRYL
ncbi:MAG: glycosyltransferase family 4 protein [Clostridiales bacterium]|nr:glycosyltransferase family 4 protein [Clostridiales bacterium]